jgi:hypothetical protein
MEVSRFFKVEQNFKVLSREHNYCVLQRGGVAAAGNTEFPIYIGGSP